MFSRLWRSSQIILCAISGGSLEKLTRARRNILAHHLPFEISGFFSGCSGHFWGCSWFSWGCSGFSWGVPGFLGSVPGFSVVPECSGMFQCSGVPGSTTCRILLSVHMEISARSPGMKLLLRNKTKLMELKLLSFETVVALWTVITLLIKLLIFAYS